MDRSDWVTLVAFALGFVVVPGAIAAWFVVHFWGTGPERTFYLLFVDVGNYAQWTFLGVYLGVAFSGLVLTRTVAALWNE